MSMQARELETFLTSMGEADLAKQAGDLAFALEARKILRITPNNEIPAGVRREALKVGTMTKADFRAMFQKMPVKVTPYGQDLIDKTPLSTKEKQVNIIFPTGRDLGLTKPAQYREFLAAGQAKGYEILHPEVGLYLRVYDPNQPMNDVYCMAMEPIADRRGHPRVFVLEHTPYGLWLRASWTAVGTLWDPDDRLAFSLPASDPQKP